VYKVSARLSNKVAVVTGGGGIGQANRRRLPSNAAPPSGSDSMKKLRSQMQAGGRDCAYM
jgi:hypothetical protein